ncbi:hypothetical protein CHUAL_014170 [Chamberlinius hualienensis]
MPIACAVIECRNTGRLKSTRPDIIFHQFPTRNELICQKWVHLCKRKDKINTKNARICSNHFVADDYERDLKNELLGIPTKKLLKSTAIPSVFNGRKPSVSITKSSILRSQRLHERKEKEDRKFIISELLENYEQQPNTTDEISPTDFVDVQTNGNYEQQPKSKDEMSQTDFVDVQTNAYIELLHKKLDSQIMLMVEKDQKISKLKIKLQGVQKTLIRVKQKLKDQNHTKRVKAECNFRKEVEECAMIII